MLSEAVDDIGSPTSLSFIGWWNTLFYMDTQTCESIFLYCTSSLRLAVPLGVDTFSR